jgi:hypothetical protein
MILRIEVTPRAVKEHRRTTEHFGMTQVAVTSRLIMWLVEQPDIIQARILGLYPESTEKDVSSLSALIMAQMATRSIEIGG